MRVFSTNTFAGTAHFLSYPIGDVPYTLWVSW